MQRTEQTPKRKMPDGFFNGYRKKTFDGPTSNGNVNSNDHDTMNTERTENRVNVAFTPSTGIPSPHGTKTSPLSSFWPRPSSTTITGEGCSHSPPTQGPMISAERLTSLETPTRPAIRNAIERDGEFLFVVGLDYPIWVHYHQVGRSSQVQCFLRSLSKEYWRTFFTERDDEKIECGDLRIGNTGEELPVEEVLDMRLCGGQWMFLIEVGPVELNADDVEGLDLVDDAVEFCVQKRDWNA